jgi:hypothetical protein
MYRYIYLAFKNRTILSLNHIIATSKSITYPSPRPSPPADEGRISKNTLGTGHEVTARVGRSDLGWAMENLWAVSMGRQLFCMSTVGPPNKNPYLLSSRGVGSQGGLRRQPWWRLVGVGPPNFYKLPCFHHLL